MVLPRCNLSFSHFVSGRRARPPCFRGCIMLPRIRRSIASLTFLHAVFFQPNCIRKTGLSPRARSLSRRNENRAKYGNA
jgi:hypothetical protein